MAVLVLGLVVSVVGAVVWRRRTSQGPTPPASVAASLVDQGRDLLAPLYPSRPLSRRALPRRLLRAAEQTITVGVSGMVLVPTRIEIAVNPEDLEPFADATAWLRRDVAEALRQKARANDWVVPSGPEVTIIPDDDRPMRLPRAVGRIDAFSPDDVRTRRRSGPPPDALDRSVERLSMPTPEPTAATSLVVGPEGAGADIEQPTVPADPAVHLRLVSLAEPHGDGGGDLNVLLVATAAPLVVGRSREADLQVKDRQVSARHCELSIDPEQGSILVRDLRSTNGTFVDGHPIDEATLIPGTNLRIGGSSWRVELDPITS